jgi:hypothetical protein
VGDVVNPAPAAAGTTRASGRSRAGRGSGGRGRAVGGPAEPRWLTEIRLRAARRALWLRYLWSQPGYEGEHMLAISHSEVDRALLPPGEVAEAERAFYKSDERAAALSVQLSALARRRGDARLGHLAATLGLSRADTALFTLTIAAAADPGLTRVFGYLLDAPQPADPTPALAAALFELGGEPLPGPDSALVRWRLATPAGGERDAFALCVGWRADTTLLPALIGRGRAGESDPAAAADWSCGADGRVIDPPADPVLRPGTLTEITGLVRRLGDGAPPVEIELAGLPGSGRTALAAQAAAQLGARLVAVDAAVIAARADAAEAAIREVRRARLDGSVLAWEHAETLPPELWRAIPALPLTFLSVPVPSASPDTGEHLAIRRSVRCGPISRRDRLRLWSSLTPVPPPEPVAEWALRPAEIRVAAQVAPAGDDEVAEVCHRLLMAGTPELLSRLPVPYAWDDLVLSAATATHLHELEAQARDRGQVLDDWGFARLVSPGRGTTALFAGPSGTGKTMAAQVLARSLGLALYRVDLAGVVSKYIGETEKHLREVFEACERAPVLLLFDEADALFGKRTQVSDAHDRYANIEIDYVLQQMEQFDGLAVLATNRRGDLDTAFTRRLRFIIGFAPPGPPERERLWRLALQDARDAEGRPLVGELDWAGLARELDLTGAGIKSAAVAAAFLARDEGAPIGQCHVLAAARRELEKQGVVVRPGQLDLR